MLSGRTCGKREETKTQTKTTQNNKKEKNQNKTGMEDEPAMSKFERKHKYKELKRTLQKEWSTEMEFEDLDKEGLSAPSHFKCYTIKERKIVLLQPKREKQNPRES